MTSQEQTPQSIIFPEIAIGMVETMTPKSFGFIATDTFLTIADAQLKNGNIDAAIATARKAMNCIAKDKSKLADEVISRIGNYKKLCDFLTQYGTKTDILTALNIHESAFGNLKDSFVKMSDFLNRAELAHKIDDEKRTDFLLEKSIKIVKQFKKVQNQIDLYPYVIQTCNKLGRKKQALKLLEQIMPYAQETSIKPMIAGFARILNLFKSKPVASQEPLIKSMVSVFSREQVLTMIDKIADDEKKQYECYKTVANEFAQTGQLEDAEFFYEKILDSILKMKIDRNSLFELSLVVQNALNYGIKNIVSKAFDEVAKQAKILETFIPLHTEFNFLLNLDDFKRAELLLERIPQNYRAIAGCRIRLAARYFCQEKTQEAIRILSDAETAADCCIDRNSQLRFYQVIGLYWYILGEPKKGKTTFEKSRQQKLYSNYPTELAETLLFQIQAGDREDTLVAINQIIELAKKMEPTPNREELKVQALICELLLRCGEIEKAKQIFEKHAEILAEKPRSNWPEDYRRSDFAKAIVCRLINTFPLEQFLSEIDKTKKTKDRCSTIQLLM